MKRRELIFLLLPCLVLVGMALAIRSRETAARATAAKVEQKARAPFKMVVKSIEKIALKPDDVAAGFDTKVRVLLGHSGKPAKGWGEHGIDGFYCDARLVGRIGGREVRLTDNWEKLFGGHGLAIHTFSYDGRQRGYPFEFGFRLRDVPASYGELAFRSDWFYRPGIGGFTAVGGKSFSFLRKSGAPHATARLPLRKSGEKVTVPRVSRDPQIEVRRVVVRPLNPKEKVGYPGNDTKVEFHVFYRGPLSNEDESVAHSAGRRYLKDAAGNEHIYNILSTSDSVAYPEPRRRTIISYYFNLQKTIPKGRATFHAQLQHGDLWPLDVKATVRP